MNTTINVSLPKGLIKLAKQKVEEGYYSSVSEVVRDSMRKMFMDSGVPTFKMSKTAENQMLQAIEEYRSGKATKLNSVSDLDLI